MGVRLFDRFTNSRNPDRIAAINEDINTQCNQSNTMSKHSL